MSKDVSPPLSLLTSFYRISWLNLGILAILSLQPVRFCLCTSWLPINQVRLSHGRASSLKLPTVPSPGPPNTGNAGRVSVRLSTTSAETILPTGNPFGASTCSTLRPGSNQHAWEDTPGFVPAPRQKEAINLHTRSTALSPFKHIQLHGREWAMSSSFIDRVAQTSNGLASHAANASAAIKRYCASGYDFLVDSLVYFMTEAQSATTLALIDWNMYMDRIAVSNGWAASLPQPVRTLPSGGSILETGLVPYRQAELALRMEESLWVYAGSTGQRTMSLFGQIIMREVRQPEVWKIVDQTAAWGAWIYNSFWKIVEHMEVWYASIDKLLRDVVFVVKIIGVIVLMGLGVWVWSWLRPACAWVWPQI